MNRPFIKAIDTMYQGYQFRSRLEARWAMFYDNIGVKWQYEPNPVQIDGTGYLPDFLVQTRYGNVFHEVKPESAKVEITAPKVYLAGKMGAQNWRGSGIVLDAVEPDYLARNPSQAWRDAAREAVLNGTPFENVGPFSMADNNHGCDTARNGLHSAQPVNGVAPFNPRSVQVAALDAITRCDIFCAHIGTLDAYGTIAEIGYAKAFRKPISLTINDSAAPARPTGYGHGQDIGAHDLWFIESMADVSCVVADYAEAQAFHAKQIGKKVCREYRLISGLGRSGKNACMTFGDPYEVAISAGSLAWSFGHIINAYCANNVGAAQRVRAHRFDVR